MAIIPLSDEQLVDAFRCGACQGVYLRGGGSVSCSVIHSPGSCCHYTDKEVPIGAILEACKLMEEATK